MISARPSPPASGQKNNTEKLATVGIWVLIAYAAVRSFFAAASKPFWYDEVLTFIVTGQSSVSAVWRALSQAVDGQPLGFYLIERAAAALTVKPEIALRLPSIFAFLCILLCVFLFVRRRSGTMYALLCASVLLITVLFDTYAVEARPYVLLVACIAIALLCYQRAPEPLWLVLMGLSLVAAEAMHYYAVFAFVPFGLAEIAFSLRRRHLRPGVWLALACGLVPLAVFWPLLLAQKRSYGAHFWAEPGLRHIGKTYGWLFNTSSFHWHLGLAVAAVLILVGALLALAFRGVRAALLADPFFHEYVLAWALLSLPFVALAATKIFGGGLSPRYVLPTVLAIPLAAGYILPRLNPRTTPLVAILLFSILAVQEAKFWASQRGHLGKVMSPAASIESSVNLAGHADLPVVISDTFDYLSFAYYASPSLARRLVAVVDPPQEVAYVGSDSLDRNLIRVRSFYPLRVYQFQAFAADHPSFLLYSDGTANDWWPRRLARDGFSLEIVVPVQGREIYLVSRAR
jgi:4-amino-4-deoxy-L-arabinose transferase-like glycosyltransferase